jgi:hypothetical protein
MFGEICTSSWQRRRLCLQRQLTRSDRRAPVSQGRPGLPSHFAAAGTSPWRSATHKPTNQGATVSNPETRAPEAKSIKCVETHLVAGVLVGMQPQRRLVVRPPNLLVGRIAAHPQHFIQTPALRLLHLLLLLLNSLPAPHNSHSFLQTPQSATTSQHRAATKTLLTCCNGCLSEILNPELRFPPSSSLGKTSSLLLIPGSMVPSLGRCILWRKP